MNESSDTQPPASRFRLLAKWLVAMTVVGGVVAFLLLGTGATDAFVYSKLVHEVMGDPSAFRGRELRVEGQLRQGSIRFREKPCEWQFVLEKKGKAMPVRFPQCIVPDTFRDGMGIAVTVQGKLQGDNVFLANQVVPRCPSKYEMQQRAAKGEQMPHVDAQAPSSAPPVPAAPASASQD
jgi:cytochrome c-type biogenesis protein CcmE